MPIPALTQDPWGSDLIDHLRDMMSPLVAGTQLRVPSHSGVSTVTLTAAYQNDIYLTRYWGRGQTFATAAMATQGTVMAGGATVRMVAVVYADDGTASAPALNVNALASSADITGFDTNGEKTAAMVWTEPDGPYWAGSVFRYGTVPTTFPTFNVFSTTAQVPPTSMATNGGLARGYFVDSAAGSSIPQLTAIAVDNTSRPGVGFRV